MRRSGVTHYIDSKPSEPYYKDKLSLNEQLALDRTILANERTFLSYLRTSLTIFVVSITFIKLLDFPVIEVIGWFFLPISLVIFALGIRTYRKIRGELYGLREKIEQSKKDDVGKFVENI